MSTETDRTTLLIEILTDLATYSTIPMLNKLEIHSKIEKLDKMCQPQESECICRYANSQDYCERNPDGTMTWTRNGESWVCEAIHDFSYLPVTDDKDLREPMA